MGWFPLRLVVDLREEATVKALRAEIAALRVQVEALTARCHKAEYDLMFEFHVNEQLVDLCKESHVPIPRRLFQRPTETEDQRLRGRGNN